MFWILFFIFLMAFAMIGGAINGLDNISKGDFDNSEGSITWLIMLIFIIWLIF
jgi:hypothetical protein